MAVYLCFLKSFKDKRERIKGRKSSFMKNRNEKFFEMHKEKELKIYVKKYFN